MQPVASAGAVPSLSQSIQRPSVTSSTPAHFITQHPSLAASTVPVPAGVVVPPTSVQSSAPPTKFDLLADFGSDPFAAPTKSAAVSS